MGGSVIQATGTVEFEDGLWIGYHLKAQNGLGSSQNGSESFLKFDGQ